MKSSLFRLTTISVPAAVALVASGCATNGDQSDARAPSAAVAAQLAKYERTGEKRQCVPLGTNTRITPLDDYRFLVRVGFDDVYLNEVSGRCSNAGSSFSFLQYQTSLSQLCRLEIVNVVDNSQGFVIGSCSLGDFEKLTPVDEDADAAPEAEGS